MVRPIAHESFSTGLRAGARAGWRALVVGLVACVVFGCGRQERVIAITSEPSGAIVWLNDYELGRTPLETEFTFFGVYDVRLAKPGYESVMTSRETHAPIYEYPGIDLIAAAIPGTRRTRIEWHFDLSPVAEKVDAAGAEAALMERARQLREEAKAQIGEQRERGEARAEPTSGG